MSTPDAVSLAALLRQINDAANFPRGRQSNRTIILASDSKDGWGLAVSTWISASYLPRWDGTYSWNGAIGWGSAISASGISYTPVMTIGLRTGWAAWLTGSAWNSPTAIAFGSGTASATAVSANGLQFEVERALVTKSALSIMSAEFVAVMPFSVAYTVREVGLFNHGSANSASPIVIASLNHAKAAHESITVNIQVAVFTGSAL